MFAKWAEVFCFSPNLNFLATPVHDVDFKFTQNSCFNFKKCTIIVGGWPDPIFRTFFNYLWTVGVEWLRIVIFTKLNFLAKPPRHDMVNLNSIKTFRFDLKMHQNRWRLGLRLRPPLKELTTFYTLLERMVWKMNLLPILISWLRH